MANRLQNIKRPTTKTKKTSDRKATVPKAVIYLVVLNITIIVLITLLNSKLPPELPLFYGLAYGKEQLAPSYYLVLPSVVALVIIIINTVISFFLEDSFLKTSLLITNFAVTFFSIITTVKIIFLVGSF